MATFQSAPKTGMVAIAILFWLLFLPHVNTTTATISQQDDDEIVRVNTDLVVLNVTVLDSEGKFVNGLRKSDFRLIVDGHEQVISQFMREETPFAAALLLDTSASMERRVLLARSAAIRFLQELRPDDNAAVYRFDDDVVRVQDYSPNRDLADLVFSYRAKGMTSLNDAILRASVELGQRPESRRAIIVLSDGADTKSAASADKALEVALASNATIYAVDMTSIDRVDLRSPSAAASLRNFAAKTGGRFVSSAGGPIMREAFTQIAGELSNQYTVSYIPPVNARDGRWHTLEVKVSKPDLVVRTRKGYHAPKR